MSADFKCYLKIYFIIYFNVTSYFFYQTAYLNPDLISNCS